MISVALVLSHLRIGSKVKCLERSYVVVLLLGFQRKSHVCLSLTLLFDVVAKIQKKLPAYLLSTLSLFVVVAKIQKKSPAYLLSTSFSPR